MKVPTRLAPYLAAYIKAYAAYLADWGDDPHAEERTTADLQRTRDAYLVAARFCGLDTTAAYALAKPAETPILAAAIAAR